MTIKKILTVPNPFLRKMAVPVKNITNEIIQLLDDMLETMYNAKGIGLAATQIKDNRRLIVMDCGKENIGKSEEFIPNPIKMINPRIVSVSQSFCEREEGCLSIPSHYGKVKRPSLVEVNYINENNVSKTIKAQGLLAACIQHEIDHLDGILFIDHLSKLKKEIILRKINKNHNKKVLSRD